MTFSLPGLLVSVAFFVPSVVLLVWPSRDRGTLKATPGSWWGLTALERLGQAGCVVAPAATGATGGLNGWSVGVFACIAAYWALWARYLLGGRRAAALYEPVWRVPVPMALLPVAGFLLAGVWLRSPWVLAAAVVLAGGHIAVSALTYRACRDVDASSESPTASPG